MGAGEDKLRFSELAEEIGLSGDEADQYVGEHMVRKGYKAITDWMDPEPEEKSGPAGGTFFRPKEPATGNRPPVKRTAPPASTQRSSGQYS